MHSTLGRLFTADILTHQSRKDTGGIPFRWTTFSRLVLCRCSLTMAHLMGWSHRSCYWSHLCLSCSEWVCIVCTAGKMKDRSGQIMWLKASGNLNIVMKSKQTMLLLNQRWRVKHGDRCSMSNRQNIVCVGGWQVRQIKTWSWVIWNQTVSGYKKSSTTVQSKQQHTAQFLMFIVVSLSLHGNTS